MVTGVAISMEGITGVTTAGAVAVVTMGKLLTGLVLSVSRGDGISIVWLVESLLFSSVVSEQGVWPCFEGMCFILRIPGVLVVLLGLSDKSYLLSHAAAAAFSLARFSLTMFFHISGR